MFYQTSSSLGVRRNSVYDMLRLPLTDYFICARAAGTNSAGDGFFALWFLN